MTQSLTLKVNGQAVSAQSEDRTLVVEFLRANGLTGTHVGCDTSQCGACNILVDDLLVKSCTMLVKEVKGREITTVEGLTKPDGALGVIQDAFRTHHGLQCGFCTPGMVMAAAALLTDNPDPSEAEIRHHLEGNICRCTGYHNIVAAIRAAAADLSGQKISEQADV